MSPHKTGLPFQPQAGDTTMQQPTHGTRRDAIAKIKAATAFTAIPLAFMALGLAGQASALTPSPAFPSKTIRFVVPYPPGGPTDLMARMLQPELQQRLGVTVIVENKSGAGGNLGSAEVARQAPADGHTLLLAASGPMAVNSSLYKSMPFNPLKDLEPVVQLSAFPLVLEVHPSLGVKTVAELLALAKTRSEEHTSELQSQSNLVCRLLLEKKKKNNHINRL